MKRIIFIFSAVIMMVSNSGLAQPITKSGGEDHNAYPLIIAVVMLVAAIGARLIAVNQSRKQGNSI